MVVDGDGDVAGHVHVAVAVKVHAHVNAYVDDNVCDQARCSWATLT